MNYVKGQIDKVWSLFIQRRMKDQVESDGAMILRVGRIGAPGKLGGGSVGEICAWIF